MNTLEKTQDQLKTATETFEFVQHSANHDRKLTKDGHMNGHYVKALQELEKVKKHYEDLVHRAEVMLQNGDVPVTPSLQLIGLKNEQQC